MNLELNLPTSSTGMNFSLDNFGKSEEVEETTPAPEVPELDKTKPVTPVKEIEEVEETEISENDESDNIYYNTAQDLVSKGLINLDDLAEEDYTFEDWNEKSFQGFIEKVLEAKNENEQRIANKVSEDTYEHLLSNMSEITRKGFEFEKNNPDIADVKNFYKQVVYEIEITDLKPTDSVQAEKILEEYYKSQGESLEDARERIANLKDPIAEAVKVKPKLDKKVEEIALAKIEEQNQILAYDLEAKKQVTSRMSKIFEKKDLDGIPLTKEIKNFLKEVLVDDEVPITIKGKQVVVSGAEALIRLHKFDTQRGNLEHLMKAIIFLQAPELFEKTIIKAVEERETNRKIKENKESSSTKTSMAQLTKPKPVAKRQGMEFSTTN